MKTLRWLVLSSLVSLFAYSGYGQITIQESDLQQAFVAGAMLKFRSDTSHYVNVGKTGGPNVYDFSSLTFPDSTTYSLYPSSQVPQLAPRFNPSSLVWGTSPQNISDSPVFFLSDTGFIQLGQVSVYPDSQEYRYDTPYQEILRFPATYNLQWSTSPGGAGVDTAYVNNTPPRVTTGWNSAETYSIDGYGTLIVHGNSYECLRVRNVEVESFTYQGFNYFTKSGVSFLVSSTKDQNDTGIVKVTGITTINNLDVTLVTREWFYPNDVFVIAKLSEPFQSVDNDSVYRSFERTGGVESIQCARTGSRNPLQRRSGGRSKPPGRVQRVEPCKRSLLLAAGVWRDNTDEQDAAAEVSTQFRALLKIKSPILKRSQAEMRKNRLNSRAMKNVFALLVLYVSLSSPLAAQGTSVPVNGQL